jgi:hypothetical protein
VLIPPLTLPSGNLALSRALGDFEFKKNLSIGPEAQMITANPDVTTHEITEEDEFLVLACDGAAFNQADGCRFHLAFPQVSGIVYRPSKSSTS